MAINFDAEAFVAANPIAVEEDKFDAEAFVLANPLEGPPSSLISDPDIGGTSPPFSDMSDTGLVDDPAFEMSQEQAEEDAFSNLIQGTASEPEDPVERKRGPSIKSTGPITARERKDGDEARSSYLLEDLLKAGYKETIARNKVVDAVERLEASEDFMRETPSQFNVPGMPPELQSDLLFDEIYSRPEEFKQEQQDAAMKLLGEADALLAESAPVKHTPSVEKALRADSFTGAWSYFTENPIDFILEVSAKSGAGMAQSIGTGIAGAAATGSPLGFAAGLGIGSGKVEFSASVLEGLEASGVDINDRTSILEFVSDEESMEALYDHAYMRAGIIGTVDAVTGGIASKTLTPVTSLLSKVGVQSPKAAKIADNLVAQAGVQILGGSGGEATAQLATTGELKPGEVFAEGAAGLISAPIDVTVATIAAGNSPTNQEMKVDLSVFDDPEGLLNVGATPEEGLIDTGIILLDGNTVIDVIPDEDVTVLATVEERPADKKVPMFDEDGTFIDYGKEDYLSTRFDTETTVAEDPAIDQADTSPTYYHGTQDLEFTEFTVNDQENFRQFGNGVYLAKNKSKADGYAKDTGRTVEATVDGKVATFNDYLKAKESLGPELEAKGLNAKNKAINKKLEEEGFVGFDAGEELIIFDPKNVKVKTKPATSEMVTSTEEAIKKNPLYNKVKDAGIDPTPEVIAKATTVEQKVNESNKGQGIEDWNPGWNYVPMWDDNPKNKDQIEYDLRPTSEFRGKDPIRREKILRPLLKKLDIPLFQGNIAGTRGPGKGNVLGYYRTGKNLIRIKNNSDLEVTAHEIAHLIDYKFPEIKKFYTANRFPEEMKNLQYGRTERALADKDPFFVGPQPLVGPALESISVSYEKSIPEEGFAEFHRLYMTQPEEAKRRTPNIYNWYDNWLDTQEIGPAIKKAGLEMQAWYKQDPRLRMMSKVGTVKSINDSMNLRDWGQSARMGMVDDLQGIKRTEVNANGSISYTGPYATGRLTKGTDSVVLAAIRFGVPVWDNTEGVAKISKGSEGLQSIFDFASVSPKLKGSQLKTFMDYMYAVSSRELQQQGRQYRFTDSEMDSVIKDAEENNPQFEEAFRRYLKWNQGIVNFAVDGGLLSQKEVDGWQRMMYVPMFNVETSGRKTPGRKRLDDAGAGISRLFGSTANLNPTSENILKNARMLISATLVNAAKRDFVDFALESDRMGNTLEKLLKKPKTVSVTKEQVSKVIDDIIEEAGIVEEKQVDAMKDVLEDYPDFMNFLAFGNQQRGPNVLQVMRNGKPVEYEVIDPMAYRSLQLYNKPQQNVLMNMLAQPSNVLKRIVVTGGDFIAASVWRDAIGRFFFTESGQSFVEQAKGTFSALMKDEKYQEFLLNGGGYSGYINSEPQLRKMMRQLNPATTPMGKIARVILSPYDVFLAVEELSNAMEQGQKVAEFKKLQEQGMPTRAATLRGREMGGDFAMAGSNEIFRAYATTIPFLQPALTGMDRARAGVTEQENKGTVMAKMAAAGGVVAGLVAMQLIHFPDEYEQLEEWEKRAFVNLFYYDLNGNLKLFRLPKPFDVGVIMSTAEEAAEFGYKMATKEMDVTEAGQEFGVGVLNSMLSVVTSIPGAPVKSENDDWYEPFLKPLTSMQAVKPFYEIATNKDQFTGAPVETFGEQRLTPSLRTSKSPALNALTDLTEGSGSEVSAPVVEHFINSMLAGLGETTLMLIDGAYEKSTGIEAPSKKLKDVPGFVFIGDANKPNNRYTKEYYAYMDDILSARNNSKSRNDDALISRVINKAKKSRDIFDKRGGYAGVQIFTDSNKELSKYRKALNEVYNSPDISGDQKTELIDRIYKDINAIMEKSVLQYEDLLQKQLVQSEREP